MARRPAIFRGMPRIPLDRNTADRMLAGHVDARDVPPGYEQVAHLLDALRCDVPHVAADFVTPIKERTSMLVPVPARLKFSGLVLAAVCCLATGTAAYASGLPQSASGTASAILAKLGVHTGSGTSHPANHGSAVSLVAHDHSVTGRAHGAAVAAAASSTGQAHRHGGGGAAQGSSDTSGAGSSISKLARSTTATGRAKGAVISTAASDGHSQAGQHGGATGSAHASAHAQDGGRSGGSSSTAR